MKDCNSPALSTMNIDMPVSQLPAQPDELSRLRRQYGCGPVDLTGHANALYERHLVFDNIVALGAAGPHERFEAFARSVRDILSQRWVLTELGPARPS
jgi:starch phosphorylase